MAGAAPRRQRQSGPGLVHACDGRKPETADPSLQWQGFARGGASAAASRLEHFRRTQAGLSAQVERQRGQTAPDSDGFVDWLLQAEQVHIVASAEHCAALRCAGDYAAAGITLVAWSDIPAERRAALWRRMLRGRVANAGDSTG